MLKGNFEKLQKVIDKLHANEIEVSLLLIQIRNN